MILSEHLRRWTEIKYYYFCLDIYHINNNMVEVILLIEAISHIGNLDFKLLKSITGKILSDPYYLPIKDEVISMANLYGLTQSEISKQFGFNRGTIRTILESPYRNTQHNPTPLLNINEDTEIYKFCQILSQVQKAGIYEKEKKRKN